MTRDGRQAQAAPRQMTLRSGAQRLRIDGVGEFSAVVDPRNPIPLGTHRVEIPDEPHDKGVP
jgi:hypothetical protein